MTTTRYSFGDRVVTPAGPGMVLRMIEDHSGNLCGVSVLADKNKSEYWLSLAHVSPDPDFKRPYRITRQRWWEKALSWLLRNRS